VIDENGRRIVVTVTHYRKEQSLVTDKLRARRSSLYA
jgi:hypothetical protein